MKITPIKEYRKPAYAVKLAAVLTAALSVSGCAETKPSVSGIVPAYNPDSTTVTEAETTVGTTETTLSGTVTTTTEYTEETALDGDVAITEDDSYLEGSVPMTEETTEAAITQAVTAAVTAAAVTTTVGSGAAGTSGTSPVTEENIEPAGTTDKPEDEICRLDGGVAVPETEEECWLEGDVEAPETEEECWLEGDVEAPEVDFFCESSQAAQFAAENEDVLSRAFLNAERSYVTFSENAGDRTLYYDVSALGDYNAWTYQGTAYGFVHIPGGKLYISFIEKGDDAAAAFARDINAQKVVGGYIAECCMNDDEYVKVFFIVVDNFTAPISDRAAKIVVESLAENGVI